MSKGYEKPRIKIGNYYLRWHDKSCGIYPKERIELERFIKNISFYLNSIYQLFKNLEKQSSRNKNSVKEQIFPDLHVSRSIRNQGIKYDLYMKLDGSTFIDRTEILEVISEPLEKVNKFFKNYSDCSLCFKWRLGELLFNRAGGPQT